MDGMGILCLSLCRKDMSNEERAPGCLGYIRDLIILPSYVSQRRFGLVQPPTLVCVLFLVTCDCWDTTLYYMEMDIV